jgi:predicted nucleic acid-binding protein
VGQPLDVDSEKVGQPPLISPPHWDASFQVQVSISEVAVHLDALHRYARTKAHFVDCLIATHATAKDVAVCSFDQDFRKFADVRVAME